MTRVTLIWRKILVGSSSCFWNEQEVSIRTKDTKNGLVLTMPTVERKAEPAKEISNTLDWLSRPIRPCYIEFGWLSSTFRPNHFSERFRAFCISLSRYFVSRFFYSPSTSIVVNVRFVNFITKRNVVLE